MEKSKLQSILKKVKELEFISRRFVDSVFSGEYHSMYRGQGMEFDQVRPYTLNDDIRFIDWNVTARTGKIHIKTYREERENSFMILLDASASLNYASADHFIKLDVVTEIAAILIFSAVRNNDKVGLILFTDRVEHYLPPKKGRGHALRILRDILAFTPRSKKTNFDEVFKFFNKLNIKRNYSFLVSDFISSESMGKNFYLSAKKNHFIALQVNDPSEKEMENIGMAFLQDPETAETLLINTGKKKLRDDYKALVEKREEKFQREFKRLRLPHIQIITREGYIDSFTKQFHKFIRF